MSDRRFSRAMGRGVSLAAVAVGATACGGGEPAVSARECMTRVEVAAVAVEAYGYSTGDDEATQDDVIENEFIEADFFDDGNVEIRNGHAWLAGNCDDIPESDAISGLLVSCPDSFHTCGIDATFDDDVYTFSIEPEPDSWAFVALDVWGSSTECLSKVDLERVGQTRALDGMVTSADQRSTWTYHPDDGLNVVCDRT